MYELLLSQTLNWSSNATLYFSNDEIALILKCEKHLHTGVDVAVDVVCSCFLTLIFL